jgi:VanZ like protein
MNAPTRLRASPFVLAGVVAAAFVLSAPYIGQIRSSLRSAFPQYFVAIVGTLVAVIVLAALGAALLRIQERRALRYTVLAVSVIVAAAFIRWHATGRPEVDVVEVFHFVEYGLITWLFYRAWRPLDDASVFLLPFLASMLVGILEEGLQWFIPVRVGEVNDVFLNTVAIGCGLLFSIGVDPPPRFSAGLRQGSLARIGRFLAVDLIALALFIHVVHLGYAVTDIDTGSFVSRYSRDTLERLDRDKRAEWQVTPLPTKLRRVSREDQYMSEGVVHVQERNEQWAGGNASAAWFENRILEKYFDAVLDAPSYVSPTGHRWSPEQIAAVSTKAASGRPAASYVSDAYPYPIYVWPKTVFWGVVAALVAVIAAGTALIDRRPKRSLRIGPD